MAIKKHTGNRIVELSKQSLKNMKSIKELEIDNEKLQNELSISQTNYNNEKTKYDGLISFLSDYLLNKTNNVYKEENAIKEQINGLMVANTEPIDNVLIINEYISKVERVGTLIRPIEIPDDIANGYWKLVNGKYILDKEKYNQMWSVI